MSRELDLAAARRIAGRVRAVGRGRAELYAFVPSPPFAGLAEDPARRILLRAANRVGKTRHMAWLISRLLVSTPGGRGRWLGPSRAQVRDVAGRYFYEFLRPHMVPDNTYKLGIGYNRANTIVLRNGASLQMRAYQDNVETQAGDEFDVVAFDEPPTRAHFDENIGRTDERAGLVIVGLTAVNRPVDWFRAEVEGADGSPTEGRTEHSSGWVQYVVPYSLQNCPWYTPRQVAERRARYRGTWQEDQRINAAWEGIVEDRRLGSFDETCVMPVGWQTQADELLPEFDEVRLGIDHGLGFGKEVAYVIGRAGERYWVLAEYVGDGNTSPTEDAVGLLDAIGRAGFEPGDVGHAFGDIGLGGRHPTGPTGGERWNLQIQRAIAEQLGHSPFEIRTVYKRRRAPRAGEAAMNHAFREGRLKIAPECKRLIHCARHYTGREENLKDAIDALRYGIQDRLLDPHTHDHDVVYRRR